MNEIEVIGKEELILTKEGYGTTTLFQAMQYNADFGPTQIMEWLHALGIRCEKNSSGRPEVFTDNGMTLVTFGHYIIPYSYRVLLVHPHMFEALFQNVRKYQVGYAS